MPIKASFLLFLYIITLPTWGVFGVQVFPEESSTINLSKAAEDSHALEVRLLLWNVYKEGKKLFQVEKERLFRIYQPNTLVFQEAYIPTVHDGSETRLCFQSSDCYFSAAFNYDSFHYGVLTTSLFPIKEARTFHSDMREPILSSPKTSLLTEVQTGAENILIINTHGINFVGLMAYHSQLKEIAEYAKNWPGPIVWAGDFNSWNPGRMDLLKMTTERLGLTKVQFNKANLIKGFMGFKLDHVFVRDLKIREAKVIKTRGSDHNALFLTLKPL